MDDTSLLLPAANVVGALAVFVLWGFPSIFFHELGHAVAAKLLHLKPTHLIVGDGEILFNIHILGVDVIFRLAPIGGVTLFAAPLTSRLKALILVLSGPLSHVLIILMASWLWSHTSLKMILGAIIFAEVLHFIQSMVPGSSHYEGTSVPRDGRLLLQILCGTLPDDHAKT
jgi:membrane-associated protease RseP (regulator of RpoE activity)